MSKKYKLYDHYKVVFETLNDGYSYFFGYYDKSPLNADNTKLLSHRISFDGRDVQDGDMAEVGYFDLNTNEFIKIDETLSWNWQQGSQLQWMPPNLNKKIIYNTVKNNKFVSVIYNVITREKSIIPFPVYAIHPNGKEALGVNYERHYWCRPGYNYQSIKNKKWDKPYHEEDGIYKIGLETKDVELLIKITDIVNNNKLPEFDGCNNWLEHMMYNPSGSRFMFFHRWDKDGIDASRVYTADSIDGNNMFMYPDVKFYSHYFWKNEEELSIWTYDPIRKLNQTICTIKKYTMLKNLLKPLFNAIKVFLPSKVLSKIQINSKLIVFRDRTSNYVIIGDGKLVGNGHQSWFKNDRYILNDTYQDKNSYRYLTIYDTQRDENKFIGKFFSVYNDSGYRCDLHPSLSIDNKYIIIDTADNKQRKQIIIAI